MDTEILMSVVSATAAIIGVGFSFASIKIRSEAERRFLDLLGTKESVRRLRRVRARIKADEVVTSKELQQLIDVLDAETKRLSIEHRRLIIEGLHQPSIRGRARYVAKLMEKVGIGSRLPPLVIE